MNALAQKNLHSTLGSNELPWQPMRRLGDASLKGFRVPYPGLNKIVKVAKNWIENYRGEQFVRDLTIKVTRGISPHSRTGHPDMRNFDNIAKAIHDWIVREITYIRDENGIERLQTPDATLQLRSGDCDDMVILAGAMLESVGVPTRIKLIGTKPGQFSHIYLEYESIGQWKSFDPTLALYPGFEFPKNQIKADKTVSIPRPVQVNPKKSESSIKSTRSKALSDAAGAAKGATTGASFGATAGSVVPGVGTAIGAGVGTVVGATAGWFSGGNNESQADKDKQTIQKKLKNMGYPQYSKMSGWGGDEAAKNGAMQVIFRAIQQYPNAGDVITNYLEGGKITPQTITLVQQNFPDNSGNYGNGNEPGGGQNNASMDVSPLLIGGGLSIGALLLILALK